MKGFTEMRGEVNSIVKSNNEVSVVVEDTVRELQRISRRVSHCFLRISFKLMNCSEWHFDTVYKTPSANFMPLKVI